MYEPDRKMLRHALAGRLLGAAARRLEGLSLAHIGASLCREVRDNAFPLLTDDRGLSFPITDRQALNHFLVYGPKTAARSRLLLDIADARVRRGSGLLHVSTADDAMDAEIQERMRSWSDAGSMAVITYTGLDDISHRSMFEKVFEERWIVFVRLPAPDADPEVAHAAAKRFWTDLQEMADRISFKSNYHHWRGGFLPGIKAFTHVPTPIVFDDVSWFIEGVRSMQASQLKALGFSIVHGLESDTTFGTQHPIKAAYVLMNAMTKVVMGDELTVTCGRTRMPRLGPDFFRKTAEIRDRQSRSRTPSLAMAH